MCRSVRSKQDVIFKYISRNNNPADISTLGYLLWTERSVHPGGNKGNHRTGPNTRERIKRSFYVSLHIQEDLLTKFKRKQMKVNI